ncbi:unnamed protein product [Pleuronectes platessa]|uniref:Uncharacterized protein n=1 Tax=Pleuronectes platessa TaxID=8262 RepID=A0A9N7YEP6_PLEPL|nr:unnamed protein product [Pleuronectes platessa]
MERREMGMGVKLDGGRRGEKHHRRERKRESCRTRREEINTSAMAAKEGKRCGVTAGIEPPSDPLDRPLPAPHYPTLILACDLHLVSQPPDEAPCEDSVTPDMGWPIQTSGR